MTGKGYLCVIGKLKELTCHSGIFIREMRTIVGGEAFPWTRREVLFQFPTTDLPYVFDEAMRRIAKGYEDCGNEKGLLSLISVSHNFSIFGAEDGLYAVVTVHIPRGQALRGRNKLIRKALFVIQNHMPVKEGQKLKLDLLPRDMPCNSDIPTSVTNLWMKAIVERRGRITQHILFGRKGEAKKVHVFCRTSELPTYEDTWAHNPMSTAPFRKVTGVVIRDGMTHVFHLEPEKTSRAEKGKTKKG